MKRSSGPQRAALLGLCAVLGLGALFWGTASPDRLLERSYARIAPQGTLFLDDAGSEGAPALPVRHLTLDETAPLSTPLLVVDGVPVPSGILGEPLAAGDRVAYGQSAEAMRTLEVVDAAELGAPVVGMPGVRLQIVTARVLGGRVAETLQLIFAVRDIAPGKVVPVASPGSDKVL